MPQPVLVPLRKPISLRPSMATHDPEVMTDLRQYGEMSVAPSSYRGGHGSQVLSFRAPAEFLEVMHGLMEDNPRRWEIPADVYRTGLLIGLDVLQRLRKVPLARSPLAMVNAQARIAREQAARKHSADVIEHAAAIISDLMQRPGGRVKAESVIREVVQDIEQIDDPFWRGDLARLVDQQLRPLLTGRPRPGVLLAPSKAVQE
jgi:hypothetical protein